MKSKYLIVVSFDAVSSQDLKELSNLPNFRNVIERGACIQNVESVYPTLTYPAHATIITGKYPKNHGIMDNTIFKAGDLKPNWYWLNKYIKGDTIIDLARRKGMKTCSILWPVTGRGKVDFNFPEIFPVKWYQNQILMSLYAGTFLYQYRLNKKYGYIRKGISQPYLDDFVLKCVQDTIENIMPQLMLVHFTDVDTNKHLYGASSKEASEAVKRQDERLGKILDTLEKKHVLQDTDIIILGDHGAKDVSKIIKINKLLLDKGFIRISKKNKVLEYDAICKSLDGSAYIYLKDFNNEIVKSEVEKLLKDFKDKKEGIEFILNNEEIIEHGADPKASFMIEGCDGYYFVDDFTGEIIENIDKHKIEKNHNNYKGVHGYYPGKDNYKTFFIAYGKDFKEGKVIKDGKLINHGPTIAKLLGGELKDCDGCAVDDIFA